MLQDYLLAHWWLFSTSSTTCILPYPHVIERRNILYLVFHPEVPGYPSITHTKWILITKESCFDALKKYLY